MVCRESARLIYLDESHFHRDLELVYTWATTGEPTWRVSNCPGLADRINRYGAYDFSQGQCFIWQGGPCDQENSVKFLHQLTVTQHHCHASVPARFEACQAFIQRINRNPEQIFSRLWPKFDFDPDYE